MKINYPLLKLNYTIVRFDYGVSSHRKSKIIHNYYARFVPTFFLFYFRLRAANVLLINIRGLGSEIAKNILLSGINSLTILDEGIVTEEELNKNFLLSPGSVGKKVCTELS